MNALLLTLMLAAVPEVETVTLSTESIADVAATLAPEMQNGTLIFSKGDCLAVKIFTASPYTHVAGVVMKDGKPVVYDSMNGVGTRCLPLADWLETQRPDSIFLYQPREAFSVARTEQFQTVLDHELNRPYAIKHHLTGKRCDGVHCAEYMTDALCAAHLIQAKEPPRVSPASLREGLLKGDVYHATKSVVLTAPEPPVEKGSGWCSQLWIDTKVCTSKCCTKMRRVFLCR